LEYEFELRGIQYERQKETGLKYKGREMGRHRIDYLIEDQVIVELKSRYAFIATLATNNVRGHRGEERHNHLTY